MECDIPCILTRDTKRTINSNNEGVIETPQGYRDILMNISTKPNIYGL